MSTFILLTYRYMKLFMFYAITMNNIKILLGKRIKEIREKRGFTQQELAEKVGIDQRNLSKIECGVTFPSKNLCEIACALEIEISELFNFEHHELNTEEKKEFIKNSLNKLDEKQIEIIFRLIRTLHF